jgi:hypothetical protein
LRSTESADTWTRGSADIVSHLVELEDFIMQKEGSYETNVRMTVENVRTLHRRMRRNVLHTLMLHAPQR